MRRDRPLPQSSAGSARSAFQVYIDNLDEYEVVDTASGGALEGKESETACRSEEVYEAWKAPGNRSKSFVRVPRMTSLGIETDGLAGTGRLPEGFLVALIAFTLWSLALPGVSIKHLQILAGRWVRAQQMARATSGIFHHLWYRFVHGPPWGQVSVLVASELLGACCLAPCTLLTSARTRTRSSVAATLR